MNRLMPGSADDRVLAPSMTANWAGRSGACTSRMVRGKLVSSVRCMAGLAARSASAPSTIARSIAYHRAELKTSRVFLRIGGWPIWSVLVGILALWRPAASLLPVGGMGIRHWTARSALYAAQTFLLAASAHGLDTCPMEGFVATKVARALGLPRDLTIPLLIAVGHAAADARCEPRWRKPLEMAVDLL